MADPAHQLARGRHQAGDSRLRRAGERRGSHRGARGGLRQRRHALVREADADSARLHPPPARRDGRGRPRAAQASAMAGRLRPRLRLARLRDGTSTTPATTAMWRCSAQASSPPSTASVSRTSRRTRTTSYTARSTRPSAARTSSAATRRWSTCSAHLQDNGFANYIVSGGGRDFMRPVTQETYGVPSERVIGSASTFDYQTTAATSGLKAAPEYLDDGPQKPIRIWSRVGRRPLMAVGNSTATCHARLLAAGGRPSLRCSCCTTTRSGSSPIPPAPRPHWNGPRARPDRRQHQERLGLGLPGLSGFGYSRISITAASRSRST